MRKIFQELLEQELHSHFQNYIFTKSGQEKLIAWNNTVLRNLQGDVIGTMSIGEDITERQAMERIKDEFIAVVSHELRTPLTSILTFHGILSGSFEAGGSWQEAGGSWQEAGGRRQEAGGRRQEAGGRRL